MLKNLFTAALMFISVVTAADAQQAQAYVYRGAGCTGRDAMAPFAAMLGKQPAGVVDFADNSSFINMRNAVGWGMSCWSSTPYRLALSVPMLMQDGSSLADGAKGAYDKEFLLLAQQMVAAGYGDSYLRIGWEMNGNWYRWSAANDPVSFRAYFRRIVHAFRIAKGQHFKIVWNPGLGQNQLKAELAWPGDGFVDVIGMDVYNTSWRPQDTDPASRWDYLLMQPYGLNWLSAFAKQHRKPIALPEWGTGASPNGFGGGDDPLFVANMAAWIANNNVVMQSYWDYNAGDYNSQLSAGQFPKSEAAFTGAFALVPGPSVTRHR